MYRTHRQSPLAPRAAAVAVALVVHAVAIAGLLHVRARHEVPAAEATVQVAFVDHPDRDIRAPERPNVALVEVKPVIPDFPQIDLPAATPAPAPAAITLAVAAESAPPEPVASPRAADDVPVVIASVDYIKPPAPVYPPRARRTRAEGLVLLQVLIDAQGRAREVRVKRSSGHEELDVAARDAVLAAAFRPYVENGTPRSALVDVPIEFTLAIRTASR